MTDFAHGEGAVSRGPMVVAFAAGSDAEADRVVAILESHAILSVVDRDLEGGFFPKAPAGVRQVLVPATMRDAAQGVIQAYSEASKALPSTLTTSVKAVPVAPPSAELPRTELPWETHDDEADDQDDGPIDFELPPTGAMQPRLLAACGAIGLGLLLQILVPLWTEAGAVAALGARMPLMDAPWRLITAGFMHGGVVHAVSNGLFGVLIGVVLFGTHRMGATATVWLLTSIAGIGAEVIMSPGAVVIGASAGNYGLVGLWTAGQLARSHRMLLTRREQLRTVGFLLLLVPGALTPFSFTGQKIAVLAHVMGFATGLLLGRWFRRRLEPEGWPAIEARSRWTGWVTVCVVLVGFLGGMVLHQVPGT